MLYKQVAGVTESVDESSANWGASWIHTKILFENPDETTQIRRKIMLRCIRRERSASESGPVMNASDFNNEPSGYTTGWKCMA